MWYLFLIYFQYIFGMLGGHLILTTYHHHLLKPLWKSSQLFVPLHYFCWTIFTQFQHGVDVFSREVQEIFVLVVRLAF